MNFRHPKWPIDLKWPEMQSKMIFEHPKFCKKFHKKIKFRIDKKWPEMRSKVNFGYPKWPTTASLSKISNKNKVAYRSEMARNAIESEFRTSKMGAGGHFVKNPKKISVFI